MLEKFFNAEMKDQGLKSIIYMAIGSLLIGIGPFFVENSGVSAETNTFYRLLIGTAFFLGFRYKKNFKLFPLSFFLFSCVSGLLLFLDLFLWNKSVLLTSPGIATVLSNLEIIFLVILGRIFFKEFPSKGFLCLCPLMLFGICALVGPVSGNLTAVEIAGFSIALGASLSYGLYLFFIKYLLRKHPKINPESLLAFACLSGCIILGIYMIFNPERLFFFPSKQSFLLVFVNAILTQVLGWWLISVSINYLTLYLSGIILLLQPAVTYFLDSFIFNRSTHPIQIGGAIFLFCIIFLTTITEKKKSNKSL